MYLFRIFITSVLYTLILFLLLIKVVFSNDNIMKDANTLFDQGKYIESVMLPHKILQSNHTYSAQRLYLYMDIFY